MHQFLRFPGKTWSLAFVFCDHLKAFIAENAINKIAACAFQMSADALFCRHLKQCD
jgi:hypothetical protein